MSASPLTLSHSASISASCSPSKMQEALKLILLAHSTPRTRFRLVSHRFYCSARRFASYAATAQPPEPQPRRALSIPTVA
jgi:hypothetical protein